MINTEVNSVNSQAIKSNECYHCGETCDQHPVILEDKAFCCEGCKMVYEILNTNDLCQYYEIDENAGVSLKGYKQERYAYLDEPEVTEQLIAFTDGKKTKITFHLPQIHCASCIWLLENLYRLNEGILYSKVNFIKKEIYLTYDEATTSLRSIVELLASIGYAPAINLGNLDKDKPVVDKSLYYKIGVAAFAFGNIMLLSFPEYLGIEKGLDSSYIRFFGWLNILLVLPVVLYSGFDYLRSAYLGLKEGNLNIDVPVSLGILTLFFRSAYEILSHTGAGYMDSLAGFVFFLLVGKWFQQRTYHHLSFERDYKSYFPIAANLKLGDKEKPIALDNVEVGNVIIVRNNELIPTDGLLMKGEARIDYSFVTGEAEPVKVKTGEKIFAGGRQLGEVIELTVTKKVAQSYLTQLWNEEAFSKENELHASALADKIGKYFTFAILLIAFTTLAYWLYYDPSIAFNAFTAVLIIACPCAVALSIPFTFGNVMRILARNKLFLKNTQVIETLQKINAIVFDKTGTLTNYEQNEVVYDGHPLSENDQRGVLALATQSNHPLSRQIAVFLDEQQNGNSRKFEVKGFQETVGEGISGEVNGEKYFIGSPSFVGMKQNGQEKGSVYVKVDNQVPGHFVVRNHYRKGLGKIIDYFRNLGTLYLLSGDNDREKTILSTFFQGDDRLLFRQSPKDKLQFIKNLNDQGDTVLMMGDGLNDSGALKQSNVGIVITENTNNFTPACDAIFQADQFERLPKLIGFARASFKLVLFAYFLALIYNVVGLTFAVQGLLSPVVAAILMPTSSVTIVVFGISSSNWLAYRHRVLR